MTSARPWTATSYSGGQPEAIVAFDVETTVDRNLMPSAWGEKFPKPLWHRLAAVSIVEATILREADGGEVWQVDAVRSGGEPGWAEERLLAGFWNHLRRRAYRLVTWNGSKFDMPVMLARSMVHGVDAGVVWQRGTRWENYTSRSPIWHLDVMQALSGHGAAPSHGLDEAAVALGWPGKSGEHGSLVEDMMAAGDLGRVRRYCECDAAQTFGIALAWMRLSGSMSATGYARSLDSLLDALDADPTGAPHLAALARAKRANNEAGEPCAPPPVRQGDIGIQHLSPARANQA